MPDNEKRLIMQSAWLVDAEDVDKVIEEARIKVKALLAVEDVMLS